MYVIACHNSLLGLITHNVTFPRITFRILLSCIARREVVNCGMDKVTWFCLVANHVHSALCIPHSTFRISTFCRYPLSSGLARRCIPLTAQTRKGSFEENSLTTLTKFEFHPWLLVAGTAGGPKPATRTDWCCRSHSVCHIRWCRVNMNEVHIYSDGRF